MSDLYPTKTRLALLRAVADGAVTEQYPLLPSAIYAEWDHGPGEVRRYQKVTARVDELARAGWIRLGDRVNDEWKAPRLFVITTAGERVLEATV